MSEWFCKLSNSDLITLAGTVVTAFGVLFALYSSWKQGKNIRNQLEIQNKQLITQQFAEYTRRYQEIIVNFPENINDDSFDFDSLSFESKNKVMRYMRLYFDLCFEEWLLNQKNLIDELIWFVWLDGMSTALNKSAFIQAWQVVKTDTKYGDDFERFVEKTVQR